MILYLACWNFSGQINRLHQNSLILEQLRQSHLASPFRILEVFLEQRASANVHNIPFFLFSDVHYHQVECLLSQSGLFSIQNASLNIIIYVHQFHSSMTVSFFVSWIWIGCFWRQIWWLMALQLNTVWEFGQLDFKRIFLKHFRNERISLNLQTHSEQQNSQWHAINHLR